MKILPNITFRINNNSTIENNLIYFEDRWNNTYKCLIESEHNDFIHDLVLNWFEMCLRFYQNENKDQWSEYHGDFKFPSFSIMTTLIVT